jgi:hypothetical protein
MTTPKIDSLEAMERFMDAVQKDYRLFAHPDTIQQMSDMPATRDFASRFEANRHLEPGDLIAIDPAVWTFTKPPLTIAPGATNGRV